MKAIPEGHPEEAYCGICYNAKVLPELYYLWTPNVKEQKIYTGKMKTCGCCEGTGISKPAKEWREKNGWKTEETCVIISEGGSC